MKHTMNDENRLMEPTVQLTRARAKALGLSGKLPATRDDKQVAHVNSKRPGVTSLACSQHKKRAVLKDVTNITCEKLYVSCINVAKVQGRKSSLQKEGKVTPACVAKKSKTRGDRSEMGEVIKVKEEESQVVSTTMNSAAEREESINVKTLNAATSILADANSYDIKLLMKLENLEDFGVTNIDSHMDPLMCSLYAADIYSNLHAAQGQCRPKVDYMEKLQRDISPGMRGILIDWLVEVCEEYNMVPDTLYLTVNLIDRYLSGNSVEKEKLQLLGVTCMLIASKYEELCTPQVTEFCNITDNTYTKEEVVKMESGVMNFLSFRLSVPTTKMFLRRFIQAAQVSYKVPSVELEFLANYLAELTLIDYSFLMFVPSLIAASAVFLARWTLDQSQNPWNPTLEYYTRYKNSDLESSVLKLEELQENTSGYVLNSIREKYKQPKFKCVTKLRSVKSVKSLFQA